MHMEAPALPAVVADGLMPGRSSRRNFSRPDKMLLFDRTFGRRAAGPKRVDDSAKQTFSDRHRKKFSRRADFIAFLYFVVIAEDNFAPTSVSPLFFEV